MSTGGYNTGINVDSQFPGILFIYKFFNRPGIVVDGTKHSISWGQSFVPAAPGAHTVELVIKVFYGLLSVGKKTVQVNVTEGQTVEVVYKPTWWLVFIPGKAMVDGQPA